MSKKIGMLLIVLVGLLSFGITFAQSTPYVDYPSGFYQFPDNPCYFQAEFFAHGLRPGSGISVSVTRNTRDCQSDSPTQVSDTYGVGIADSSGTVKWTLVFTDYGNTTFAFYDDAGNTAYTSFSMTKSHVISNFQTWGQGANNYVVPTDIPVSNSPSQGPVNTGGAYPQGHEGVETGGIHFTNYCNAKYNTGEYNNGRDPQSWGCGGQTLDHNMICFDIYGTGRQYAHYKGSGLGDVYCGTDYSSGNSGWSAPAQNNSMPPINDKWCAVQRFDTTPSTSHFDLGTQVQLFGRGGDCKNGNNGLPRSTRFSIDGVLYGEKQQSENSDIWDTSKSGNGSHVLCFMVASDGDSTWEHRDEQCRTYTVGQGSNPVSNDPVVDVPNDQSDCNGVLPALVHVGSIAVVNNLTSGNVNIRSIPHVSSETKISSMPPLATLSIVDGPVCAEDYRWWQVGYNGTVGWAAEAGSRGYNFVPNGTPLPYDPVGTTQPISAPVSPPQGSSSTCTHDSSDIGWVWFSPEQMTEINNTLKYLEDETYGELGLLSWFDSYQKDKATDAALKLLKDWIVARVAKSVLDIKDGFEGYVLPFFMAGTANQIAFLNSIHIYQDNISRFTNTQGNNCNGWVLMPGIYLEPPTRTLGYWWVDIIFGDGVMPVYALKQCYFDTSTCKQLFH